MLLFARRFFGPVVLALVVFLAGQPAFGVIRDGGIDPANLGKGDWIYYMSMATNKLGGNVASVTNEHSLMRWYTNAGIRYIIVKAATSDYLFNGTYSTPQFTSALVQIAHAHGLLIFGYNRSDGLNVPGEILISDYVFNQGADGFVWDAESEWESQNLANNTTLAWQLCSAVRSNWPTKFLAHAPFDIVSYHSSFPYKEFGYWSDVVMPQIYHFTRTGIKSRTSGNINWADANWKSWQNGLAGQSSVIDGQTIYWTNAIKPLAPANHVYGPNPPNSGVSEIPPSHVMEFVDCLLSDPNTVTAGGYKGASFWRTDLHGAAQWANIKAATIGDFPGVVNNIVIDSPNAIRVGGWTSVRTFSNGTFYGDGSGTDTNSFGSNYLAKAQGTGAAYIEYRPNVIMPGNYDVFSWHPTRLDASASVPHVIQHSGGSTTNLVNQTTGAGTWTLLGRFNFNSGTNLVRVYDNIPEADKVALSDGVKLAFVMPAAAPAAPDNLSAVAAGTNQINLTWRDNSTNESAFILARSPTSGGPYTNVATIAANTTNYNDPGLLPSTAYYYVVRATNIVGASASSAQASATTSGAPTPPGIVSQPASQSVIAGQPAAFSVTATGSPTLIYQWRFNGAPISGATDSVYTFNNAQTNHAGGYSVVITNSLGSTTSISATLTVNFALDASAAAGGSVAKNPDQSSYAPGSVVLLTATPFANYAFNGWSGDASGTNNPLSVTLGTNTSIAASFVSTLTDIILDNTNAEVTYEGVWQAGTSSTDKYLADYRFASGAVGGLSNAIYRPNIGVPGLYDVFIWYPQGSNRATNAPWTVVYDGGSTNVPVNQVSGGGQWVPIATARPFVQGNSGYVRLSNDIGYTGKVVMADAVRFSYVGPLPAAPTIHAQPQDQTVNQGGNATFDVAAAGVPAPEYQWRFGGTNISGATASSYTRFNAQPADAGDYSVVVSNSAGSAVSSNAQLTVNVPASITAPPQSLSVKAGSNVTFTVIASGTPPPVYQWSFNGTPISGATGSSYLRPNVQTNDAGLYGIIVTNVAGSASNAATLTVTLPLPTKLLSLEFQPDRSIRMTGSGEPGDSFVLQASSNLLDWESLSTNLNTNGAFEVADPATNLPQRFYRTRN